MEEEWGLRKITTPHPTPKITQLVPLHTQAQKGKALFTPAADRPSDRIWKSGPSREGPAVSALMRKEGWKKMPAVCWGWCGVVWFGCV